MKGAKTGGRSKGTPNKRTTDAQEIAERLQCDPFEVLCFFAKGDWKGLGYQQKLSIPLEIRAKAAAEASKYLYPQRKAMEHTTGEEGFKIIIEDYRGKK